MAKGDTQDNQSITGILALTNVAQCMRAMEKAVTRPRHLEGIVGFYGPSGYGKSQAAAYVQGRYRAYYLELRDSWGKKAFLQALLKEMTVKPAKTISDMAEQAAEQLALAQGMGPRPLIIDEGDKAVDHGYIELIRDIYEGSGKAPILLVGEEQLERKLRQYERCHRRVLAWVPAQPASLADCHSLLRLVGNGVQMEDDLLEHIRENARGVTGRISQNLFTVSEQALLELDGKPATRAWWAGRPLYNGEANRGVQL